MTYYPYATENGATYTLTNAANGAVAVFNDDTHPLYAGFLSEVVGLDSPEVRESAEDLAQADGGSHGYFFFGRRPITMNARLFGHASVAQRVARIDRIRRATLAMRADSTLSWKPSARIENLVTNPRAQNNATGWTPNVGGGETITRVTGVAPPVGTTAIQVVTTGAGLANQGAYITMQVEAGKTYAISAAARRTAGTQNGSVFVSGVVSATLSSTINSATWTTFTTTVTPSTSGAMNVAIGQATSNSATGTYQISDVMVSPGTDTTYRDGDTAGWFWSGDVGNSASGDFIEMFTNVRRQGPIRESGDWVKEVQIPLVSEYAGLYSVGLKTLAVAAGGAGLTGENRGSWPAFPILRITGPTSVTNPTITQTAGGSGLIATTGSLLVASGETIEFDTLNHTATFTAGPRTAGGTGNANSFINFATTIWPTMPTGNSTFVLNGTTGTLTALWRDTWV